MPYYGRLEFPPSRPERPYVILNMVVSLDGRTADRRPGTRLGSATDHRLMRELRFHADVVLVGGATFRAAPVSPRLATAEAVAARERAGRSPVPLSAVVSRSGQLPLDRPFFRASDFEAIVYLSEDCPGDRRAAIEMSGRPVVSVPAKGTVAAMLSHMRHELGAERLLLESGPVLNRAFIGEDAVDEWFLTLAPFVASGPGSPPIAPGGELARMAMDLVSCEADSSTGEVFVRYRRCRP